jgi:heme/copper-type cytochrome/quinol oxidase subunit 4
MIDKLLWFLFGAAIVSGIVGEVIFLLIARDKAPQKKFENLALVCFTIFIFVGLFVSISWAFFDYWV